MPDGEMTRNETLSVARPGPRGGVAGGTVGCKDRRMNRRAVKRRLGAAVRGAQTFLVLDFTPRLPPWSRLQDDHSVTGQLRQEALRLVRATATSRPARAVQLVHGVVWTVRVTFEATAGVVRNGKRVRATTGVGRWRQWRHVMSMAHTMNYSPRSYYMYRFWDPAIRPIASTFLQEHEMAVLQRHLNRDADMAVLNDKEQFDKSCATAGFATPSIVATLSDSATESWPTASGELPRCDLFVKPVWGQQGRGGERWVYDSSADLWSRGEATHDHDGLVAHCRSLAKRRPTLVQECLSNHPDIERFSTGPLCTFRAMTYRNDDSPAQLLALTLKMARTGSDVDNRHAGGLVCAVDAATGLLGPGTSDPADGPQRRHPDTGELIDGAQLTTHREVIDLVLAAHEQLDVPWSVGWDVAMTPSGPVLVEGNPTWGIVSYHMPHAVGLEPHFAEELLRRVRTA